MMPLSGIKPEVIGFPIPITSDFSAIVTDIHFLEFSPNQLVWAVRMSYLLPNFISVVSNIQNYDRAANDFFNR